MTSKSLKFFKFELDIYDYVPEFYSSTPALIFISIRLVGASPQIGEILRFCDFFLVTRLPVYVFFSRARAQVEPVDGFSRFMVHTTCFAQGRSFWGCDNSRIHLGGNILQKTFQKGRE